MGEKTVRIEDQFVYPSELVFEYVSNGSTTNAVGDYSSSPETFKLTNTSQRLLHASRMMVYYEDVGAFPAERYGADIVLTNGVHVSVEDGDDVELKSLSSSNSNGHIYTNAQWSSLCFDVAYHTHSVGLMSDSLAARWTFRNTGKNVTLKPGHSIVVTLNDDFTGLVTHKFMVQGHYG